MSFQKFADSLPPSLSLKDRSVLLTGSSSGIGRQCALHLARHGAKVLCCDLTPTPAQERVAPAPSDKPHSDAQPGGSIDAYTVPTHDLINQAGGRAQFFKMNVTKEEDWKEAVKLATELGDGRLDLLINNAGIVRFSGGLLNETMKDFDATFAVNVRGLFIGTREALAQMVKQPPRIMPADHDLDLDEVSLAELTGDGPRPRPAFDQQDATPATSGRLEGDRGGRGSRGGIINIGSLHGIIGGPGEAAYGAAKGAVVNFTRQVAGDYASQRININCICPGYVESAMTLDVPPALSAKRPTPWPHRGTGRDVAKTVVYLARDAPWLTGSILMVDGGTSAR
ncbi:Reductases with broad range of substrate specificities [Ceraceosorus bombacis]|uniref:Reductases with broad range of substrate specificities n=1 Tax=Ceraceosorus bombacis TaxID=401625 RepID=A0A0P1BEA1_9BASI|nr:Reductases with broad range of substrate specificities [Ceraceosorus bombacis]